MVMILEGEAPINMREKMFPIFWPRIQKSVIAIAWNDVV